MKKRIFAMLLTVCMMATLVCAATVSAKADWGDVFRISGQRRDGSLVELKSTSSFADGWNYAIEKAIDHDWLSENGYVRIVADLLADWNAVDGEFGSGDGFKWDTIFVEEDAIITLNLNGHTIDRRLTDWTYNGEVISVDDDVDLIINGGNCTDNTVTGTITGGFSCNGAGGIHIEEDSNVTLNNVDVVRNQVEDDYGSAIAVLDGSRLTMNGGSISNNELRSSGIADVHDGTVYIEEAKATFNKVTFSENRGWTPDLHGMVVCLEDESEVTLNECIIENYGKDAINRPLELSAPNDLFYSDDEDSELTLNKCTVRNNNCYDGFFLTKGKTVINDCTFTGNSALFGIFLNDLDHDLTTHEINNSSFIDNQSPINYASDEAEEGSKLFFTNCTFNKNENWVNPHAFQSRPDLEIRLVDCDLGDSVFTSKENVAIIDTSAENGAEKEVTADAVIPNNEIGSVFGEGSLTAIVSFLALFISISAIGAITASNRKRKNVAVARGGNSDEH